MVASSMHKPGWRSRRRSRLSLVERAVPRLGRFTPPDDAVKTSKTDETAEPSEAVSEQRLDDQVETPESVTPEIEAAAADIPDADLPDANLPDGGPDDMVLSTEAQGSADTVPEDQARSLAYDPSSDEQPAVETSASGPAAETSVLADEVATSFETHQDDQDGVAEDHDGSRNDDADDEAPAAQAVISQAAVDRQSADMMAMQLDDVPSDDDDELDFQENMFASEPTTEVTRPSWLPSETVDDGQTEEGSEALVAASASPSSGAGARPETEARMAADDEADTQPRERSSSALSLDWNNLVACGFTDPRDRSQPLPDNMDGIIRALVRQALSDQSSWRDRVVLVTSPRERVSKSTAAINFAFGLTTVDNHHAVLVDVDTGGAGAVTRLGGGERIGVAQVLNDDGVDIRDLVIETDLDRLTLVASGFAEEDTLDRFASRRMLQILRHLTDDPDTILVIDAPPILASQEAAVLSVIAGQVVLAVEAGRTTADQIEHALQRIGDRHNVSLVLSESCGVVDREQSSAAAQDDHAFDEAHSRIARLKRRLPKAATATAAGTVALGILAFQPDEVESQWQDPIRSGAFDVVTLAETVPPARTLVPPERLSIEMAMARFSEVDH